MITPFHRFSVRDGRRKRMEKDAFSNENVLGSVHTNTFSLENVSFSMHTKTMQTPLKTEVFENNSQSGSFRKLMRSQMKTHSVDGENEGF